MGVKVRKRKCEGKRYSLYLDIYMNGKRESKHLGLFIKNGDPNNKAILAIAEKKRAERELELQYENFGYVSEKRRKGNFVEYFEKLVNERPTDRSSWSCTLKKLKTFTKDHIPFNQITTEWLEGFQKFLLNEVSEITAWHYYSNVKYALNKAYHQNIIPSNPSQFVKGIKKPETKREYLTIKEVKKLANTYCSNQVVKDAFLFSCFSGLRYSDVVSLTWDNIVNDKIEFKQKKTGGVEYLPISQTAKEILAKRKSIKNKSDFIFDVPTKVGIFKHIKKWVKAAGIKKRVSFHTARHTFATMALTQGVDLYTVSKLLGHKDIATTQVYAKIVDQKKDDAVNKLPKITL